MEARKGESRARRGTMVVKAEWAAESTEEREEDQRAGLERCGARSGSRSSKGSVSAKEARKQGMARRRRSGRETSKKAELG